MIYGQQNINLSGGIFLTPYAFVAWRLKTVSFFYSDIGMGPNILRMFAVRRQLSREV
jgi:hypothetical protein